MNTLIYGSLFCLGFLILASCTSSPRTSPNDNAYTITINSATLCGDPTLNVDFTVSSPGNKNPIPSSVSLTQVTDNISSSFDIPESQVVSLDDKGVGTATGLTAVSGTHTIKNNDPISIQVSIGDNDYTSDQKNAIAKKCKGD